MSFETENVNVGDKVICYSASTEDRIGIITKKTPKGFIDVNFGKYLIRFDKYGREKGENGCLRKQLEYYTEEKGEKIRIKEMRKALLWKIGNCQMKEFGVESLEKIWGICQEEMRKKENV